MVSVYEYMEYRRFLKDRFNELKSENPHLSYRAFNRRAGIKSSGFLKLVMDGKRNLADEGMRMVAKGFRLTLHEERYFATLVRFNQAAASEEKDRWLRELMRERRFLRAKPLTVSQYRLFSRWYYVALLELVRLDGDGVKDVEWLHERIHPRVDLRDMKQAVKDLMELGLLTRDRRGSFRRVEAMLTTPDEIRSVAAANYHHEMCRVAAGAVLHAPSPEREFSTLTIATSPQGFQLAKREIQEFRKRLHSILEQVEGPKTIVSHVNLQLFQLNRDVHS